jgi:hypothetical protein
MTVMRNGGLGAFRGSGVCLGMPGVALRTQDANGVLAASCARVLANATTGNHARGIRRSGRRLHITWPRSVPGRGDTYRSAPDPRELPVWLSFRSGGELRNRESGIRNQESGIGDRDALTLVVTHVSAQIWVGCHAFGVPAEQLRARGDTPKACHLADRMLSRWYCMGDVALGDPRKHGTQAWAAS